MFVSFTLCQIGPRDGRRSVGLCYPEDRGGMCVVCSCDFCKLLLILLGHKRCQINNIEAIDLNAYSIE